MDVGGVVVHLRFIAALLFLVVCADAGICCDLPLFLAGQRRCRVLALEGDPEAAFWAIAMDPLTSTKLTLKNCRKMVAEMFEAERQWLPQFDGKSLREIDDIDIPAGTVGVPVPTDPALAINARFNKLGQ